ncbi:enoyl-CoA hydratase/isomerase family protein [Mycobacterium sp. C31M]
MDVEDGVALVRMDGGPMGLLDRPLVADLATMVDLADRDPGVKAVVLTGARPDRFAGHADVRWMREGSDDSPSINRKGATALMRFVGAAAKSSAFRRIAARTRLEGVIELDRFHDTFVKMNTSSVVYVAAINGSALGGGAELAWACDVRFMADHDDAFIGQPEVLMGFNPGGGGTQRLAHLIGPHRALTAILDGTSFTAAEALGMGAVDAVVPPGELVAHAVTRAHRLGARPTDAIGAIKRAVYFGASSPLRRGLLAERAEFLSVLGDDQTAAIMNAYVRDYESAGRLLLHDPASYERAVENGHWAPAPEARPPAL